MGALVLRGNKEKTVGGLTKDKPTKSKRGKVVSKKASTGSKKRYAGSKAEAWMRASRAVPEPFSRQHTSMCVKFELLLRDAIVVGLRGPCHVNTRVVDTLLAQCD